MSRLTQATAEATWTREQATQWARGLSRWPRRRFRLEQSRAGSSRLVIHGLAERLQKQYGGEIVEVIPAPVRRERITRYEEEALHLAECSWCGAAAGAACKAPRGAQVWAHKVREMAP